MAQLYACRWGVQGVEVRIQIVNIVQVTEEQSAVTGGLAGVLIYYIVHYAFAGNNNQTMPCTWWTLSCNTKEEAWDSFAKIYHLKLLQ